MTAAVQVRRARRIPRKPIDFSRMVHRIADQHGVRAAQAWSEAVLNHQKNIDIARLRSAIASKNVQNIEAVVQASALQQNVARSLRQPFTASAQAAGTGGAAILKSNGLAASFNAVHPNVVNYAREQSAQLVVGIPAETKQVIAEVIALGASQGLTIAQQARAIREVVGLPPAWARAPLNLADEIRQGNVAAATGRRLSAVAKQQIRSRVAAWTVTDAFVDQMSEQYAASLINRRALNIARTETLRASHAGLTESWKQAQAQGVLPDTARRFWIVTPDDRLCPICVQVPVMNPSGVDMEEPFETPEGPVLNPPAVHPNCRCSVGLLPNMPDDFDVTEEGAAIEDDVLRSAAPSEELNAMAGRDVSDEQLLSARTQVAERIQQLEAQGLDSPDNHEFSALAHIDTALDAAIDSPLSARATIRTAFVYDKSGRLVAGGLMELPRSTSIAFIHNVGSVTRGGGELVMRSLLLQARERASIKTIELLPETSRARSFFTRMGFNPRAGSNKMYLDLAPLRAPAPFVEPGVVQPRVLAGADVPTAEVHQQVVETLRSINVDPEVVTYKRLPKFKLDGTLYPTAGEYSKGRVYLDARHVTANGARELVTHEAQHLKFDVAMKTDPRVRKYIEKNYAKLRAEDGVTAYSRQHWQAYESRLAGVTNIPVESIPINETLSEIAASRATGAGEAFYGSETYRKLAQMVDEAYARAVRTGRARVTTRSGVKLRAPAEEPKPPLRDFYRGEKPTAAEAQRDSLTNHLDGVFEDNFRAVGAELEAVDNYMSYHYAPMNNALRSGNVEEFLKKAYGSDADALALARERLKDIEQLDKLMARMPELGDTATVWRSVDNVDWMVPRGEHAQSWIRDNVAKLIGTEIRDPGFVSTTTLSGAARGWSKLAQNGGTIIEIRLPPNARGAWMKKVAPSQQDSAIVKREYLLPRGAKFKVVRATVDTSGREDILHLIVEYIP